MKNYFYIIFILSFNFTYGQTFSVSGKVTDEKGNPLSRVNIIIEETKVGTASESNGSFKFDKLKPLNYTFIFSAIGYSKKSVNINLSSDINDLIVTLETSVIQSEQVVVTAGKYEQLKNDLPVSAEVIRGEEIEKRNFNSLDDAMRYIPGVSITLDQISIRGSSGYSRNAGTRVLLLIDGIPIYTPDSGEIIWELLPISEIERIEVIKGAASSLYGSAAIGGVINVIQKKFSNIPETYIKGSYGFYDKPAHSEWDWSGERRSFNGLTISHKNSFNKGGYTFSLSRFQNDSYRKNNSSKQYSGSFNINYKFNNTTSLQFFGNGLNREGGNFLFWKDVNNALVPPDNYLGERVLSNRYMLGLIIRKIVSDNYFYDIKSSYYLNKWEQQASTPNSSTSSIFRSEIQSNYILNSKTVLITGVEASFNNVNSNIFGNPSSRSFGIYSQLDYKITNDLLSSTGLRFDYTSIDSLEKEYDISPKIAFNYKLSDNFILRSSAGTAFRAPTLAETFTSTTASGILIIPNSKLKPEKSFTFEFGLNYNFNNLLITDFAIFQSEFYDYIEPQFNTLGQVQFQNLTRARIQGFEFNNQLNLLGEYLSLKLNYNYLWGRDINKNSSLKYRPRHNALAGLNSLYNNFELGIDFRFLSRIEEVDREFVDFGIIKQGDTRVDIMVTDARILYKLSQFNLPGRLILTANNIFNYNYVEMLGNISPIRNFTLGLEFLF